MSLQLNYRTAAQNAIAKARSTRAASGELVPINPITLTEFKRRLFRRYQHARHLQVFDDHLMQVARYVETGGREGIGFLISEMPPRHGKSFTLSRFFPAWFLGRNPDYRVMNVSYGATLAEKGSRLARNLIASPDYQTLFPGVQLDPQSRAVDAWNLLRREGGMDAMGVLGGATGKGADVLNCDDLIKNREEAESRVIRDKTWDALNDDLLTRLEPGGAVILNGTRWHEDDPIGRALKYLQPVYGDKMVRLRFTAVAEADDPLGRAEGEALWSERYPIDVLNRIRTGMGAYSWSALYQQRPAPREGGLFKWKDIDDNRKYIKPNLKRIVVAIDPAVTAKADSDETGIVVAGVDANGHGWVLEDASLKASPDAWAKQAISRYYTHDADRIVVEVNNGGDLCEHTLKTVDRNVPVTQLRASRGKVTRAEPIAALYEQGRVHHLGTHTELESQMMGVLDGANSPDRVDALVWALTELMLPSGRNMWSDVW